MSCYNQCGECLEYSQKTLGDRPRPFCGSSNRRAYFYHSYILLDYDTSKCLAFKRRPDLSKMIEINPMYKLQEIQGLLVREVKIIPQCNSFPQIQLTPHGALALGRQLIQWAMTQDSEIEQQYAGI